MAHLINVGRAIMSFAAQFFLLSTLFEIAISDLDWSSSLKNESNQNQNVRDFSYSATAAFSADSTQV